MDDKILLVDDDNLVLACFARLLSRHFTLDTAPGPWEALHAISTKGPYAVVVSDMRMPGLNGFQFLQKAKKLVPGTVGILLSGDMDYIDAGPNDAVFKVISKPCPYEELVGFIQEAIAYHHAY